MTHDADALMYMAIKAGTDVFFAKEGLEDWEGGDDLVICPDASPGCANCQNCPCAEVHSSSECHEWVNIWGEHKESCGCPECEVLDQFKYDELHPPIVIDWGEGAVRFDEAGSISTTVWANLAAKAVESQFLLKKFGTVSKLPAKTAGPIRWRRYAGLEPKISGEDFLTRQLEKTDEQEEKKKMAPNARVDVQPGDTDVDTGRNNTGKNTHS